MKKREKERKLIFILAIIFLVLLLVITFYFYVPKTENTAGGGKLRELSWSFSGNNWYSEGFTYYDDWRAFLNLIVDRILDLEVQNLEGDATVVSEDENGTQHNSSISLKVDKTTGTVSWSLGIALPSGEMKRLDYMIYLNNEKNIGKFFNISQFSNMSLRQILEFLLRRNMNITFVGNLSNITLSPAPGSTTSQPKFQITYERVRSEIGDGEDGNDYNQTNRSGENNQNNSGITHYNKTIVNSGDLGEEENIENKTSGSKLKIINPIPGELLIFLVLNEKKTFSVGNKDYDMISWYLNGKKIKTSTSYVFTGLKIGDYNIRVDVEKGSEIESYSWEVEVDEKEKPSGNWWIYLVFIVVLLIFAGVAVFFIILKKKNGINSGKRVVKKLEKTSNF